VLRDLAAQVCAGGTQVMGVMLESHLVAGNQKIPADLSQLTYGQSITDACIDLPATTELLAELAEAVAEARQARPVVVA